MGKHVVLFIVKTGVLSSCQAFDLALYHGQGFVFKIFGLKQRPWVSATKNVRAFNVSRIFLEYILHQFNTLKNHNFQIQHVHTKN